MNSQAPILMSAEVAWPARPSGRGMPSPSQPSALRAAAGTSSPNTPTSPNFNTSSFASSSSSAYDPAEHGALSRKSSLGGAIRHDGGHRFKRKSQLDKVDRAGVDALSSPPEVKRPQIGTPLQPDRVARIAQAFGVNITLPQPPASSPQYRIGPSSRASSATYASPPSPSTDRALNLSTRSRSSPGSGRALQSPKSTKFFVSVLPPASLAPKSSSAAQFRRGELLPLHPTLQAQVQAIANEYNLPTTVGIVLFLVYEGAEAPPGGASASGPRLGKETWRMLWSDVLGASSPADPNERGQTAMSTYSQPPQLLPSLLAARVGRESSDESETGNVSLYDSVSTRPSISSPTSASPSASRFVPSKSPNSSAFPPQRTPVASSSLLTRDPATLSPSYFKLTAGRQPSASSSRHRRTLTAPTNPSSASSGMTSFQSPLSASTHPTSRPFSPTTLISRTPTSPSHYLSPSVASSHAGTFAPPPLRIVGTVEFDIDQSRGGDWYPTWLNSGKRGVERVGIVPEAETRPIEAVARASPPTAEDDSSSEYGDEGEAISDAGSGYVPLSDDGETDTRETSEEPKDQEDLPLGGDPLGDVFPSDEQEWDELRAARGDADEDNDQKGLGIRSSRGGRESLILTGGELSRGLEDELADDFEEDPADLDRKEIEELLARHPPTPGYGNVSSGETSPGPDSPADTSSTPGRSTRRSTTLSNPLNLTLASPIALAGSPTQHFLPVLTTSPTASEAQAQGARGAPRQSDDSLLSPMSETSGGLAYLRGNSLDDNSMRSDSLDGGMSAAMYGAFGVGEHGEILGNEDGNRGSAFLMHESLNDLEKALASLSPRDLRIPNRDRPYDASPNSDASFNSAAIQPAGRPRTPPDQRLLPQTTLNDSPSSVPSPQFRGKMEKSARDAAVLSIASSFLSTADADLRPRADVPTTPHSAKSTFADIMAANQQQDVPPLPAWPAVPVTSGSPLLNQIALPIRKDSPLPSPSSASSARFPDSPFVPASPPRKISVESMQRMEYDRPRIRASEDRPRPKQEEEPWQPHKLERMEVMDNSPNPNDTTVVSPSAAPRRSNSITRAIKNINWGGSRSASASGPSSSEQASLSPTAAPQNANGMHAPSPPLPPLPLDASPQRHASFGGRLHPSFSGSSSVNGRVPTPSPTRSNYPTSASLSSPRSVSDSASSGYNQFGKYTNTFQPDSPSAIMQPNQAGSPTPPSPKNSAKGKSRFKAPFTAGSIFGKKKPTTPTSEISSPDLATSGHVPTPLLSQGDDSPHSSQRAGSASGMSYIPHSLSNLSLSSHSHTNVVSHSSPPSSPGLPGGPSSAQSPRRELKRKPVPNVGAPAARERTSSTYSTHSRASSFAAEQRESSKDGHAGQAGVVPEMPDQPLPLRSTSLKAVGSQGQGGLGGGGERKTFEAADEDGSLA